MEHQVLAAFRAILNRKGKNRSRTVRDYRRLLRRHFALDRKKLAEVTTDDILKRLERIKDAPAERNHALVAVKIFLKWARQPPRSFKRLE